MNEYYSRLTEHCKQHNQDREALLNRRMLLLNELQVITNRLETVDSVLEAIYNEQERYWPTTEEEITELTFTNDIIKEYYADPDISHLKLAIKLNVTHSHVTTILNKHFKEKLDLLDKINPLL